MEKVDAQTQTFTLLYFASAATLTDTQSECLAAPTSASRLFQELTERYPGMREKVLDSAALTINLEYVNLDEPDEVIIKAGDEVAIIPPVSSG